MALVQDVKYAVRMLLKEPGFTAVAVLALALGIGMNTTVFTFVNAVLIRGLPFEDSHQLLHVDLRNTSTSDEFPASWPEFEEWRSRTKTFSDLAGFRGASMNITETSRPPERAARRAGDAPTCSASSGSRHTSAGTSVKRTAERTPNQSC